MGITHVIRGEDHLSNTAKHIALFRAFGVEPPNYAHIPLILNADGSKMSKRDTGASLPLSGRRVFARGRRPITSACSAGRPRTNREKLTLAEVIERFDLPQILRHNARFDHEKLLWLQGEYARELSDDRFYELAVHAFAKTGVDTNKFPVTTSKPRWTPARANQDLLRTAGLRRILFPRRNRLRPRSREKEFRAREQAAPGKTPRRLCPLEKFDAAAIEASAEGHRCGTGRQSRRAGPSGAAWPCTGNPNGPSLYHLLEVLGKEKALVSAL
jgi:glutamyl/glutaminyl-tRNA synthetase